MVFIITPDKKSLAYLSLPMDVRPKKPLAGLLSSLASFSLIAFLINVNADSFTASPSSYIIT